MQDIEITSWEEKVAVLEQRMASVAEAVPEEYRASWRAIEGDDEQ